MKTNIKISLTDNSEAVLAFDHNNAGLKKLSSSVRTDK
jgi:hypothetical protein